MLVCGRAPARSPYRLPPQPEGFDPRGTVQSASRERNALLEGGETGIHSCSTVGPGGWTGCDLIRWRRGLEQRAGIHQEQRGGFPIGSHIRFGVVKH